MVPAKLLLILPRLRIGDPCPEWNSSVRRTWLLSKFTPGPTWLPLLSLPLLPIILNIEVDLFFPLSSAIAFSKSCKVISSLHIGQRCCSCWFGPDNHFMMHSEWKICLQVGIFLIDTPFENSSIQITQSAVPNSSMSLFFLYLIIGINFLYRSINSSWTFFRIASRSSLVILAGYYWLRLRRAPECLEAFSLIRSSSLWATWLPYMSLLARR